jgi:hypothetical protein
VVEPCRRLCSNQGRVGPARRGKNLETPQSSLCPLHSIVRHNMFHSMSLVSQLLVSTGSAQHSFIHSQDCWLFLSNQALINPRSLSMEPPTTTSRKSSPDLNGIPAELTAAIIKFLPRVDIFNLSLACRHLRNQTEPELYREFVLSLDRKLI